MLLLLGPVAGPKKRQNNLVFQPFHSLEAIILGGAKSVQNTQAIEQPIEFIAFSSSFDFQIKHNLGLRNLKLEKIN